MEYYLRAQEPLRAAQVAARTNNARRAAELYERGGDLERAARSYEDAGMPEKARELRAAAAPKEAPAKASADLAPLSSGRSRQDVETRFREALSKAGEDPESRQRVQELAREAAEELLREGGIRRAADIYRDAGLIDEAIHLYVNVLGAPGEAAPLVAARGNHERAAELYELAGKLERAATVWIEIARAAAQPEVYVDRIERLSSTAALAFLEEVTAARPIAPQTVELHYRFGCAVEKAGDIPKAVSIFEMISQKEKGYKDVAERLRTLRSPAAPPAPTPALAPVAPSMAQPAAAQTQVSSGRDNDELFDSQPQATVIARPRSRAAQPTSLSAGDLPVAQITMIAEQAAKAAIEQARRGTVLSIGRDDPPPSVRTVARIDRPRVLVVGLEQRELPLSALADSATIAARGGPSIDSLHEFIGKNACDLQNIEVYYRLGLAYLAQGMWAEALSAFDAVEEASPGYRDADRRANHVREWQKAVGPRMSLVTKAQPSGGQTSGRYRIHGELGRGGMAVVYRATDEVLGREVALKFLAEELTSQREMREMFEREARSVARLNHPNIITVYDFGMLDSKAFICMEYVDGSSLEDAIDQRGKLTVVESLRMVLQVLDALQYAHSQNIIHRDIKPSNMMQTKSGLVKLMDFGLAKSLSGGNKASIIAGTPAYMPPEQFAGGAIDARADLFSVGCSLYEMLTGQLPFEGADRSHPATPIHEHDPRIPETVQAIVHRSIELAPGDRFEEARAFSAPLRRVLDAVDRFNAGDGGGAAAQSSHPPDSDPPESEPYTVLA